MRYLLFKLEVLDKWLSSLIKIFCIMCRTMVIIVLKKLQKPTLCYLKSEIFSTHLLSGKYTCKIAVKGYYRVFISSLSYIHVLSIFTLSFFDYMVQIFYNFFFYFTTYYFIFLNPNKHFCTHLQFPDK